MKNNNYQKGIIAEKSVIKYLLYKGYKILSHRFKCPYGEIDIISLKNNMLSLIEVKNRSSCYDALYALQERQQSRIRQAASFFLVSIISLTLM